MTLSAPKHRFRWTAQVWRAAVLLSALGYSDRKIGDCLGCHGSTIGRHLGLRAERPQLSPAELMELFERYDAQRNLEEVLTAASGTTQQARLRTSLRVRGREPDPRVADRPPSPQDKHKEALSDEQLRREVESLVGQRIGLSGAD
ncbi:MAG: hypothetical protein AAF996_11580 [Pseudomonadota bacterium]